MRTVQLLGIDDVEVNLLYRDDFTTFDVQALVHLHD
jgi:hypothetical protein